MPKKPENNQRASLDDRRNNLRERIITEVQNRQNEIRLQEQVEADKIKADYVNKQEYKDHKYILQEERDFEKSISALPQDEIKQKRLDRIEQVKQWYKEAKISDNYLIERTRQLYHNLPGDIPNFYKYVKPNKTKFFDDLAKEEKAKGKRLSDAEKNKRYKDAVKSYPELLNKEEEQFKKFRSDFLSEKNGKKKEEVKFSNPDEILEKARYTEFKSSVEKEIADEIEAKKATYDEYKALWGDLAENNREVYITESIRKKKSDRIDQLYRQKYARCQQEFEELKAVSNISPDYMSVLLKQPDPVFDQAMKDLDSGAYELFTEEEREYIEKLNASVIEKPDDKVEKSNREIADVKIKEQEVPTDKKRYSLIDSMQSDFLNTSNATVDYFKRHIEYGLNYALAHNGRMDRSILMPAFEELSELTVLNHDAELEYKKQSEATQKDVETHQKAKPWIVAKWLGVKRWKKWENRNKELETKRNNLNIVAQRIEEQKQLVGQYITGLKTAGVSQAMIDKCTTYENVVLGTQVADNEIKHEVARCKKHFDNNIKELKKSGKIESIRQILLDRTNCIDNLYYERKANGKFTEEEMDALYRRRDADKTSSTEHDKIMESYEKGELSASDILYGDFLMEDVNQNGLIDSYDAEIFDNELNFDEYINSIVVPTEVKEKEIVNENEELQNSLFEKTAQVGSGLSGKVDNIKETQKTKNLEND